MHSKLFSLKLPKNKQIKIYILKDAAFLLLIILNLRILQQKMKRRLVNCNQKNPAKTGMIKLNCSQSLLFK